MILWFHFVIEKGHRSYMKFDWRILWSCWRMQFLWSPWIFQEVQKETERNTLTYLVFFLSLLYAIAPTYMHCIRAECSWVLFICHMTASWLPCNSYSSFWMIDLGIAFVFQIYLFTPKTWLLILPSSCYTFPCKR